MSSPTVRARPRRRFDASRKPQILAAAVELVREKGLWSVRVSDVARRAGVSPANVVYYFGTKDDLFAQAIADADDAFYAELDPALAAVPDAPGRLALLIVFSATADWLLWVDLWVYARHHPEIAGAQRGFNLRWREVIAGVIRDGERTGDWTVSDADGVAQRLAALTDGFAVQMMLGEPSHTPERYVTMTLTTAARELNRDPAELLDAATRFPLGRGAR